MDLKTRRKIVEACYLRHGHKVLAWLSGRAVPTQTERIRDDAVSGERVWAAATMELRAQHGRKRKADAAP
ncbi:MAG: hypothetical protein ACYTHN_07340 [Planctomycetota bacterium]|jgi:hypothetical protein